MRGVDRVLSKLESAVTAGNYYEAHQMYRTLYFRYLTQKNYSKLLTMLEDGAKLLLQNNQQASGADLAILLVDVLVKSETQPSDHYFTKIAKLFAMVCRETPERENFLAAALRWSTTGCEQHKTGHPSLHQAIAQVFWKEKNYVLARYHFLRSTDGSGFATMLIELHKTRGYACEIDLFIAQVVLQYLCLHNKRTATVAFQSYTSQHPNIDKGPPYILPLLNFIWFLLKVIESGKLAAFNILCKQYQQSIERDPAYVEYLDKIAQIFFGVNPPRPQNPNGFFGDIFQSLMNGVGDEYDSDDDDEPSHTPRPSTSSQLRMETEALD